MESFTRPSVRLIQTEIEVALKSVAERHGLNVKVSGLRFNTLTCGAKIELSIADGSTVEDNERQDFEMFAQMHGLKPEDFGRSIVYARKQYTICGIRPNSPKFPILVRASNGKQYKIPLSAVTGVPVRPGFAKFGQ